MVKQTVLLLSLVTAIASCTKTHPCRPGTLFVTTTLDGASAAADSLQVRLHRDGHSDDVLAPFARKVTGAGSESFEISFASYVAGSAVTVYVIALAAGTPVAESDQTIALAPGCTSATIVLGSDGVPSAAADMAMGPHLPVPPDSPDMTMPMPPDSPDMTTPMDPTDMTQPLPPADLSTAMGAPDAPGSVTSTALAGGLVQLSWSAPNDHGHAITGYDVTSSPAGFSMTTSSTSVTTSALTIGQSYSFAVRAHNAVGVGPPGNSPSVTAGDVPSVPTNVHATAAGLQGTVTWSAAAANGYPVSGYTVNADNGGGSVAVDGMTTTATVGGLANGQSYHFTVTAKNALGTSSPSAQSNAITAACTNTAYSMYAIDTTTVQYAGPDNTTAISYIEARHDARPSPFVSRDTTGWALFQLVAPPTGPPANGTVTAVSVSFDISTTISSPAPSLLEIWYSTADGWRSTQVLTATNVPRTQTVSHSPVPPGAANTQLSVNLDVPPTTGAHDWSNDLAATDRFITVGVRNVDLTDQFTYMRFLDASAGATSVPVLNLTVCQ